MATSAFSVTVWLMYHMLPVNVSYCCPRVTSGYLAIHLWLNRWREDCASVGQIVGVRVSWKEGRRKVVFPGAWRQGQLGQTAGYAGVEPSNCPQHLVNAGGSRVGWMVCGRLGRAARSNRHSCPHLLFTLYLILTVPTLAHATDMRAHARHASLQAVYAGPRDQCGPQLRTQTRPKIVKLLTVTIANRCV